MGKNTETLYWAFSRTNYSENVHVYDFDVFFSYARMDEEQGSAIAHSLVETGYRVFFAPKSLEREITSSSGFWGPRSPYGWSGELKNALLRSIHFVGLITPSYTETPWCDLEYLGFKHIRAVNECRRLALLKLVEPVNVSSAYSANDGVVTSTDTLKAWLKEAQLTSTVKLGEPISPIDCFDTLPIYHVLGKRPWDDSENGSIHEPPYRVFAGLVLELIVRLRKGASPNELLTSMEESLDRRLDIWAALEAAVKLVEQGIGPEPGEDHLALPRPSVVVTESGDERSNAYPTTTPCPPLSKTPPKKKVWDVYKTEDGPLVVEAICNNCRYEDRVDFAGGDRLMMSCPKCGYDGTDALDQDN